MTYTELRTWFKANMDSLPTTRYQARDGTVYLDAQWTANLFIETTDKLIKELGNGVKQSKQALHNKNMLHKLYNDLNDKK